MNTVIDGKVVLVAAAAVSLIAGAVALGLRRDRAALCFIAGGLVLLFTAVMS